MFFAKRKTPPTTERHFQKLAAAVFRSTGRKPSNLSRTLKTMEHYGFARLHRGMRGRVRPEVPYQSISHELPFSA
jgi:predicted transcriptional regulator